MPDDATADNGLRKGGETRTRRLTWTAHLNRIFTTAIFNIVSRVGIVWDLKSFKSDERIGIVTKQSMEHYECLTFIITNEIG